MIDRLELHALADGQLEGADRQRVSERVASCEESAAEYQAIVDLKKAVSAKCSPITCDQTWQKCRSRIEEVEKTRRIEGFVGRYAWALCSIFVVLIFGAGIMNRSLGDGVRAGDVPAMMSSLSPLSGAAPAEARDWIRRQTGAAPQVAQPAFQLVGRGIGLFEGRKVLGVRLRDREGEFVVLVLPGARIVDGVQPIEHRQDMSAGRMGQANCVTWQDGPVALIVTGPRDIDGLCALADQLKAD